MTETEYVVNEIINDINNSTDDNLSVEYIKDLKKILKDGKCRKELTNDKIRDTVNFIKEKQDSLNIKEQDKDLNLLYLSVGRLKHTAIKIDEELDSQNILLSGLEKETDMTSSRIQSIDSRVRYISNYTRDNKICCSIMCMTIIVVMLIILIIYT